MGLWDYACPHCGHTTEELTKGEKTIPCPKCGKNMEKQVTTNYKIRMSGWENQPLGKRYT